MTTEEKPTSYYSIVIEDLPQCLSSKTLQPKLHQRTPDGNYIFQKSEQPLLQIYDAQKHVNIEDCLINLWTTPLPIYKQLDSASRHIINTIKSYINNTTVAVSQTKAQHICNNYDVKKLQTSLKPKYKDPNTESQSATRLCRLFNERTQTLPRDKLPEHQDVNYR